MLTKTLTFLQELASNNNREWFAQHKDEYIEAKNEFSDFIGKLIHEIQVFDPEIPAISPEKTIFRIFRDVRFSKDKSPYKLNFGSHIHKFLHTSVLNVSGYYIHIEPGNKCMLAGGAYMPSAEWLRNIRKEFCYFGEEFIEITESKTFKKFFNLEGEKLKKTPRGFEDKEKFSELLKYKSIVAVHPLSDTSLSSSELLSKCSEVFRNLKPFNDFLNRAIQETHS